MYVKQCLVVVFIFLLDYDVEHLFILLVDLIFKEMSTHTFWITYLFFFFLAASGSMQNLSFLTRNGVHALCIGSTES